MDAKRAREIITPDSFSVAPELLGVPLAAPGRRATAMLIDLVLIAVLFKTGGVFLGIAGGILLFRAATPARGTTFMRRWARRALRAAGALVLFITVVSVWESVAERLGGDGRDERRRRPATEQVAEERDDAEEEDPDSPSPSASVAPPATPPAALSDSLAVAYAAALEAGDTAGGQAIRGELTAIIAADTVTRLQRRIGRLSSSNRKLRADLREARRRRGIRQTLGSLADDLGVGLGWSGVYFTAFLALWRGQTPGKRLRRIRVIRLDGRPVSWWIAFERFGGYAACVSTGLLGFAQILWDRNRQGIHDKITETVVIDEAGRPIAAGAQAPSSDPGAGILRRPSDYLRRVSPDQS